MTQDSTPNRSKPSDAAEIDTGQSLGSYLQRERLKKQLTLEEIAEQTRINLTTLQAIESNDRSKMPAEVFSKGFIKIYAKFLGLDVQDAIERYGREMAQNDEENIRNHDVFYNEKLAESSVFSVSKLLLFLLLLAVIALGGYFFLYPQSPQPRRSTLVFPPEDTTPSAPAMEKEQASPPPSDRPHTLQWPKEEAPIEPFTQSASPQAPPAGGNTGAAAPTEQQEGSPSQ